MSEIMKLTPEFIYALINWQEEGQRSVKIELDRGFQEKETSLKVWVYDYEILSGDFIACQEEIPTSRELLLQQKKDLDASRRHLNKQLKALEA